MRNELLEEGDDVGRDEAEDAKAIHLDRPVLLQLQRRAPLAVRLERKAPRRAAAFGLLDHRRRAAVGEERRRRRIVRLEEGALLVAVEEQDLLPRLAHEQRGEVKSVAPARAGLEQVEGQNALRESEARLRLRGEGRHARLLREGDGEDRAEVGGLRARYFKDVHRSPTVWQVRNSSTVIRRPKSFSSVTRMPKPMSDDQLSSSRKRVSRAM